MPPDAMTWLCGAEAAKRADDLLIEGDTEGYAIWRRIMEAVEGLSAMEPEGKVN